MIGDACPGGTGGIESEVVGKLEKLKVGTGSYIFINRIHFCGSFFVGNSPGFCTLMISVLLRLLKTIFFLSSMLAVESVMYYMVVVFIDTGFS